jgi:aspartate/methionine/tyrosine aminotransferase
MAARFSDRLPEDLSPNRLSALRAALGEPPFDLTASNPTECGFEYPDNLLEVLADSRGLTYDPEPWGPSAAREAIADGYRAMGLPVTSDRVLLTSSTSEAYGFLFKLLGSPGDRVLVPSPSYPLLDQLARLDGLAPVRYALCPEDEWRPDMAAIEDAPAGTRALVVVHPNNPTGSMIRRGDGSRLAAICRERGWALIADEVFLPYRLGSETDVVASFTSETSSLGFTLGGLSKSIGLPQAKLAWIVITGPQTEVATASRHIEYIADAYLSVSGPVAHAVPSLLDRGRRIQEAIRRRCEENAGRLVRLAVGCAAVDAAMPDGGWSFVMRVPAVLDDEELALRLYQERGVAVHPGYLFDFPRNGYVVLSLLPEPDIFAEGVRQLLSFVTEIVDDAANRE